MFKGKPHLNNRKPNYHKYRFQTDQRNSRYHNEDSDYVVYRRDDNETNEEDAATYNYWNESMTYIDAYRSKYIRQKSVRLRILDTYA